METPYYGDKINQVDIRSSHLGIESAGSAGLKEPCHPPMMIDVW